ncbi:putative LRR receptor-like serine/threonine-protein kinase [Apostasia shenzhenica]|uniref:Receptor kinase-like protein Xa21 n=1 Tax=Apostasia shenzhenica TaxID=1088818 RepID=A0A2H9ZU61_9ASPA|nr:putative LRR receptor-like serine/threonine-protein kinase [Apostasia shenzhenica]
MASSTSQSALNLPLIIIFFFLLSLLLIKPSPSHSATVANNGNNDRLALLDFKSLLSDPHGALASWTNGSSHCQWRGVSCSTRLHPGRVVGIQLDSIGISGPISPSISNLTFIRKLYLPSNKLSGRIPTELGHLPRLRHLNLSMNSLDGEIPDTLSLCSQLQIISLFYNTLQGSIPSSLGRCLNLQILSLANNKFTGEIPQEIASLPKLETLILSKNAFLGTIPPLLGSIPTLTYIDVNSNNLTGTIPSPLMNSSTIIYLDLSINSLTGNVPAFGSIAPSSLEFLGLSENQLSRKVPLSLGNLTSLVVLYLAGNRLEGNIPKILGNLHSLMELDLSINRFSGEVPSSIFNLTSLTYLGVGDNMLRGRIPEDIGIKLPNLQGLVMQSNYFQGQIPPTIVNASGIQTLDLFNNSLSGPIPENLGMLTELLELDLGWNQFHANGWSFLSSLANCRHLKKLVLQENKLSGELPKSVGNLSSELSWLWIGKNQITGEIPKEIGNLPSLTVLYMQNNLLSGNIPESIGKLHNLHVLELSANWLTGSIPSSIGNLTQLNELYLNENALSGNIPGSIESCKTLIVANFSRNTLNGTIPKQLVSLSSLSQFLDLSHNSLSGPLPEEVKFLINLVQLNVSNNHLSGSIPSSISSCVLLQYLHLEGNNLEGNIAGELPQWGIFQNANHHIISVFGNPKLCGGPPRFKLPPCTAQSNKNEKTSHSKELHIVKALVVSTIALLMLCAIGTCIYLRNAKKNSIPSFSINDFNHKGISYSDISRGTNNFSSKNLIGSGSFGSVYKAKLEFEANDVAVKVLNLFQIGALKSFTAECEILRSIRHRNLVKIITSCSSLDPRGNDFKALIFEYMPNGCLEKWLHPEADGFYGPKKLGLIQRFNIASNVAAALDYLHNNCVPPVVHCDLKPSNILLDNDMTAHVGDFGLASFLLNSKYGISSSSTIFKSIKGSIGYVAPEYGMGSPISPQGDVYSYGILILEMLTGKRPTNELFKEEHNLHKYVEMAVPEKVLEIVDPEILQGEGEANADIRSEEAEEKDSVEYDGATHQSWTAYKHEPERPYVHVPDHKPEGPYKPGEGEEVNKSSVHAACRPLEGPESVKGEVGFLILVLLLGICEDWSTRVFGLCVLEKYFVHGMAQSGHADCDRCSWVTSSSMLAGDDPGPL